jgi:hypothetical protein
MRSSPLVLDTQAHGIASVAGSMECLQTESSDCQEFAALQAQVDEWSGACAVHYHRDRELASELLLKKRSVTTLHLFRCQRLQMTTK